MTAAPPSGPLRVVVADDAALFRDGLARLLADAGVVVDAQVGDAAALLAHLERSRVDVAIVDVRMPPTRTTEGLEAARTIRRRHLEVGVLLLSQHLEVHRAVELVGADHGRTGYLLKERVGDVGELVDALARIAAGNPVVDPEVVEALLHHRRHRASFGDLSLREREVLALMAEGRSNQAICDRLHLSAKTVEPVERHLAAQPHRPRRLPHRGLTGVVARHLAPRGAGAPPLRPGPPADDAGAAPGPGHAVAARPPEPAVLGGRRPAARLAGRGIRQHRVRRRPDGRRHPPGRRGHLGPGVPAGGARLPGRGRRVPRRRAASRPRGAGRAHPAGRVVAAGLLRAAGGAARPAARRSAAPRPSGPLDGAAGRRRDRGGRPPRRRCGALGGRPPVGGPPRPRPAGGRRPHRHRAGGPRRRGRHAAGRVQPHRGEPEGPRGPQRPPGRRARRAPRGGAGLTPPAGRHRRRDAAPVERDLHDGAQQRLLAALMSLQLAERALAAGDREAASHLARLDRELRGAMVDLRELARGIYPPVPVEAGLGAAMQALVDRAPVPVQVDAVPAERLPDTLEAAAYFVLSEGIANAAKHARATTVRIAAELEGGALMAVVADDGLGGARLVPGGGLQGLEDRVAAEGGRPEVRDGPAGGTVVEARLPLPAGG